MFYTSENRPEAHEENHEGMIEPRTNNFLDDIRCRMPKRKLWHDKIRWHKQLNSSSQQN